MVTTLRCGNVLIAELLNDEFVVSATIRLVLRQPSSQGNVVLGVAALICPRFLSIHSFESVRGEAYALRSIQIRQRVTHLARQLLLG